MYYRRKVAPLLSDPQVAYLYRGGESEEGQGQQLNHSSDCLMFLFTTIGCEALGNILTSMGSAEAVNGPSWQDVA